MFHLSEKQAIGFDIKATPSCCIDLPPPDINDIPYRQSTMEQTFFKGERVTLELKLLSLIQYSFHAAPKNSETNRGREYNK